MAETDTEHIEAALRSGREKYDAARRKEDELRRSMRLLKSELRAATREQQSLIRHAARLARDLQHVAVRHDFPSTAEEQRFIEAAYDRAGITSWSDVV
jgi:cytochrome c-type biogenesis protein CcmH/NrfF